MVQAYSLFYDMKHVLYLFTILAVSLLFIQEGNSYVKSVQIYFIKLRIQSEYRKIRTTQYSVFGHFPCSEEQQGKQIT